jgi:hypothetical protein
VKIQFEVSLPWRFNLRFRCREDSIWGFAAVKIQFEVSLPWRFNLRFHCREDSIWGFTAVKIQFEVSLPWRFNLRFHCREDSIWGFIAVKIQFEVFSAFTSCSVMAGHQRFWGPCCVHLQGETLVSYRVTTQTTSTLKIQQRLNDQIDVVKLTNFILDVSGLIFIPDFGCHNIS